MSTKEIWWGMKLSFGLQTKIMNLLWSTQREYPIREISSILDLNPESVSAAMSNLRYAGWVNLVSQGVYQASDPRPIEDRRRIHIRNRRPGRRKTGPRVSNVAIGKVGDEFLLEIVFIDNRGPILQDDETKYLYRVERVEVR